VNDRNRRRRRSNFFFFFFSIDRVERPPLPDGRRIGGAISPPGTVALTVTRYSGRAAADQSSLPFPVAAARLPPLPFSLGNGEPISDAAVLFSPARFSVRGASVTASFFRRSRRRRSSSSSFRPERKPALFSFPLLSSRAWVGHAGFFFFSFSFCKRFYFCDPAWVSFSPPSAISLYCVFKSPPFRSFPFLPMRNPMALPLFFPFLLVLVSAFSF